MGNDPAFLFYPGDYLRDTQCLSESTQVAYDRIMCEHMRNICITHQQLKFFTKRLNDDEVDELRMCLSEVEGGFQISWVADSIVKRRNYSESRRKNRLKKGKEDMNNISKTYEQHMENENENENVNKKGNENAKKRKSKNPIHTPMKEAFLTAYEIETGLEYQWTAAHAKNLNGIANKIRKTIKAGGKEVTDQSVINAWSYILENIPDWYKGDGFSISVWNSKFNEMISIIKKPSNNGKQKGATLQEIAKLYGVTS